MVIWRAPRGDELATPVEHLSSRARCTAEQHAKASSKQLTKPNTVACPHAVVVHPQRAAVAHGAVMGSWRLACFANVACFTTGVFGRLHRPWMRPSEPRKVDEQRPNAGSEQSTMHQLPSYRHSGHQLEQCREPTGKGASQWSCPCPQKMFSYPDAGAERSQLMPCPRRCRCSDVAQATQEQH